MTSTRQQAAELYHKLFLEVQHIQEGIAYEEATSFCGDCPHKNWDDWQPQSYSEAEFGPRIADHCCKEEGDYMQSEFEHIDFCQKLMAQLKIFAGAEELEAARARLGERE